jgi:hypothetical protein
MCATGHTRRSGHALLCGPDHGHYGAHLGAKESGMSTARPDPSASHLRWLLLLVAMITITFVVTRCCGPASQPILDPQGQPAAPPTDAGHTLQAATTPAVPTETIERSLAAAPPPATKAVEPEFAELIEQLTLLGEATTSLVQSDEIEAAREKDTEARQCFEALMTRFADAGERALDLATSLGISTAPHDAAKRFVLQLTLAMECSRRHVAAEAAKDYSRLDPLVHAILAVLPQNAELLALGVTVLDKRPYLRLCHEPDVLGLVDQAGREQFDRPSATRLLLTLWDNLQRTGERSSTELASMAMLLLGDADPSKRTAACRQLLADARYRQVMLAWLRERADVAVAIEVANLAAQELPANEALGVLRELGPTLKNMPSAYMSLAFRAPEAIGDAYRELLAANTHAAMRTDLIAGLAMADANHAIPAVELAQGSDPAPEVRAQAMLTLTATATLTHGEQACHRALDDPAIGGDPGRLALVFLALQNLEAAGLTNAVDRLGQRMRAAPLREDTRLQLEQLLARALPGGQTSDQQSRERSGPGAGTGK